LPSTTTCCCCHLLCRLLLLLLLLLSPPVPPVAGRELLVSGSKDTEVRVWDPLTGACLARGAGHIGAVTGVSLARSKSKAASFLVSVGADKLVKVWDLAPLLAAEDWGALAGEEEGGGGV
jgi:WD40 repeat protein